MSALIPVVESFVSLQGEGPSAGEPALFLRLGNCNLNCVWCDTRHSWDWAAFDKAEEVDDLTPDELFELLVGLLPTVVRLVVVTGGEPLLHQVAVAPVLDRLLSSRPDARVEIETNGTIAPTADLRELVHLFVVSPKLANSKIPEKRRLRLSALSEFSRSRSVLKFVAEGPEDLREAGEIAAACGFASSRVWVMPQTTSADDLGPLLAQLAPAAIHAGFRVSSRLQVIAWGDARGR